MINEKNSSIKMYCISAKFCGKNRMEICFQGEKRNYAKSLFLKRELLYIFEQIIEGFK